MPVRAYELAKRFDRKSDQLRRYGAEGYTAAEVAEALRLLSDGPLAAVPDRAPGLRVRGVDLSLVRPVEWLWRGRLPIGYLALLLGAEGIGKGTFTAWLAARVTRGDLPGSVEGNPGRVLIVGDEDAFDSVTVPRMFAAGADLDRVDLLDEARETLDLRRNADEFAGLIRDRAYDLVLIDALLDVLGVDTDDWRSKQVRDAIRPLRRAVREHNVCALASLHPNKGSRSSFRDLISGSFAFNAQSRSSLLLAPHPDDESRRVLVRGKGNLSATPPSFEFGIQAREPEINGHTFSVPVVADEREGTLRVEDLIKPDRAAPVRETLADQIDAFGTGKVQSRAEIAAALGRTADDRSIGRALDQLESDNRWEKIGRGKWQKLSDFGIGTSREVPMSSKAESPRLTDIGGASC